MAPTRGAARSREAFCRARREGRWRRVECRAANVGTLRAIQRGVTKLISKAVDGESKSSASPFASRVVATHSCSPSGGDAAGPTRAARLLLVALCELVRSAPRCTIDGPSRAHHRMAAIRALRIESCATRRMHSGDVARVELRRAEVVPGDIAPSTGSTNVSIDAQRSGRVGVRTYLRALETGSRRARACRAARRRCSVAGGCRTRNRPQCGDVVATRGATSGEASDAQCHSRLHRRRHNEQPQRRTSRAGSRALQTRPLERRCALE